MFRSSPGRRALWFAGFVLACNVTGCCGICGNKDSGSTAKGPAAEPVRVVEEAFINEHLARLKLGAECTDPASTYKVWCPAADGFAKGTAASIPSGETAMVGLTTFINSKGDPKADISRFSTVSTLAFNNPGSPRGEVASINTSNPADKAQIDLVFTDVVGVLKGSKSQVMMDQKLANYVASRPAADTYVMKETTRGWQMLGGSHAFVRKVGDMWVVVETPRSHDGMYVSMFRKATISVRPTL